MAWLLAYKYIVFNKMEQATPLDNGKNNVSTIIYILRDNLPPAMKNPWICGKLSSFLPIGGFKIFLPALRGQLASVSEIQV